MKLTKPLFIIIAGLLVSLVGQLQAQVIPGPVSISGGPPISPQSVGITNSVAYTLIGNPIDNDCEKLNPSNTIVSWGATCGSFVSATNNPATWTNVFAAAGWYTNVITCAVTFKGTDCDGTNYSVSTNACVTNVINVLQLSNQCVATIPTNQSRTTIGVGEQVNIWILGSPTGTVTWSTSAGSVSPTTGTSTTLTAPSNAATATVTATYIGGSSALAFSVISPSGYIAITNSTVGSLGVNIAGTGMYIDLWLAPTNVSFGAVWVMEVGKNATNISGYFTSNTPPSHIGNGADTPIHVGMDNKIAQDTVASSGNNGLPWAQPWSSGSFKWPIPALWWVSGSSSNSLSWSDQVFTIDASGTMTITKFLHVVTRNTNDVYTTFN